MKKIVPAILWLLVLVCGSVVVWQTLKKQPDAVHLHLAPEAGDATAHASEDVQGAVIVDVPWKHLPDIDPFQLTDQDGQTFDSADLLGRPWAVSFFFARCPSICRDLNAQVKRLYDQLRKEDVTFVSISVDPENDAPEVLNRYAQDYDADSDRWKFLTGPKHKVVEIGDHQFNVDVTPANHTGNILLVDKWGRYRDRFKWDDPDDMKRFVEVAKQLVDETQPPLEQIVSTRNALAGQPPASLSVVPWIDEFHLTQSDGQPFFSRQLTGTVWIANFFFLDCPGLCEKQHQYLADLQQNLRDDAATIVSITTNPQADTLERLAGLKSRLNNTTEKWFFVRGDPLLTKRIGSEFFGVEAEKEKHSSLLFIIDRWGNLRGQFDWQQPDEEAKMLAMIQELKLESVPTGKFLR